MRRQLKSIAILGGAEISRGEIANSEADEFWTMNWSYLYDWIPRIDRLFEMHKVWLLASVDKPEYIKPRKHWEWLQEHQGYPVYMLADLQPLIPSCIRYPIEEVTEFLFGDRLRHGGDPHDFYSSSVDYMIALAIYEQPEKIELHGVEMIIDTEYRYQRDGIMYLIGQANARGIVVDRPAASKLIKKKRYGYEGSQMIFRQDLERLLTHWQGEKLDSVGVLQNLEGQMQSMFNNGKAQEEMEAFAQNVQDARDRALIAVGHVQSLEYLIAEIDLEEPELELINPMIKVPLPE